MKLKCNVCDTTLDVPDNAKSGYRLTCTNCFAQLGLHVVNGKKILGCAICKLSVFDPDGCEECERRHEKRAILEEGRL